MNKMGDELSHIKKDGLPGMVDVSNKSETDRRATAVGYVIVGNEVFKQLKAGGFETPKGSIIHTAIIAANMAVKKTADLIPLCHPLAIMGIDVQVVPEREDRFKVTCEVKTRGRTGVEMEALTGVSVAALTIYDMVKALSHDIVIDNIHLLEKKGGKSDYAR